MNISQLYKTAKKIHSFVPYNFLQGWAFAPIKIYFELTNRCNLQCAYCFQKDKDQKELSTEQIKKILDDLPRGAVIVFSGGEPLLRKDFLEIAEHACLRNKCALVTNGLLLNDDICRFIVENKFVTVGITIDGEQAVYDSLKGRGNYNKLMNNIEMLNKYKDKMHSKYPMVDIKINLLEDNLNDVIKIKILAEKVRADFFTVSLLKLNSAQYGTKLHSSIADLASNSIEHAQRSPAFQKSAPVYKKLFRNKNRSKVRLRFYPEVKDLNSLEKYYSDESPEKTYRACLEPWSGCSINYLGEVSPCLSLKTGDLLEEKFSAIWNNEKFKEFRRELKRKKILPICKGCCYASVN